VCTTQDGLYVGHAGLLGPGADNIVFGPQGLLFVVASPIHVQGL
jgi:hypothetical protein